MTRKIYKPYVITVTVRKQQLRTADGERGVNS